MIADFGQEIQNTYDILEEIGSGGGGTIYKAFHKRLQKYVVLKKIHSNIKNAIDIRMETDILKNLHHYYLPQVLDFLEVNSDVYTVMDFIPGKSFEQLIKEGKKFTPTQVLKYTEQICEAVAYLHEQNPPIMHGDIKPANIMLTPEDNICLIDFNISGFLSEGNIITVGFSAGYAAPEQCQAVQALQNSFINAEEETDKTELLIENDDETLLLNETQLLDENHSMNRRESLTVDNSSMRIDLRADIYSVGATVYHLATGNRPSSLMEENLPIEEVTDSYSSGFSVIIAKAMEAESADRFQHAGEMLQAVKNIHKYDRKYKTVILKQQISYVGLVIFIAVCIVVCLSGRQRMRIEKLENYEILIEQLEVARNEEPDIFENLFAEACDYMPERLDAYYQKAIYLAECERFEETIAFIERNLINEANFMGQEFADDTYYLLANCYFELEKYKEAVVYYQAAIDIDGQISQYYGDYAIALVYCDRIDNAEEILRRGRELGMTSDYVLLVSAEIEAAQGKYDEAVKHFEECIQLTENSAIKLRAYVLCDKTLREQGRTEDLLLQSIELLTEAEAELELSSQMLILERLAQDYIDLATITEDKTYDEKAIAVFNKIIQYGWDNYTTHINQAILYEKTGQFDKAKQVLEELIKADPSNYITYKRLAVLEIDIQGVKENAERNYQRFLEYYNMTMELYSDAKLETNDVEIQWLEQAYVQLVSGGWLEE